MDRIEQSTEAYRARFGEEEPPLRQTDPELCDILTRFVYGDVAHHGALDAQTRELICIVVLAAIQTLPQLRAHVAAGLNVGLSPEAIREALYQCAPYTGAARAVNAVEEMDAVFEQQGIRLPLPPQGTTDESTRYDSGLAVQIDSFGEHMRHARDNAPAGQAHIRDYLSAYCFGDFYTRKVLDMRTRELLTLCILCALGGCENQVKGHIQGNINVGNSKQTLVDAVTQCMPYIGFPRTLNALGCINEVLPEE